MIQVVRRPPGSITVSSNVTPAEEDKCGNCGFFKSESDAGYDHFGFCLRYPRSVEKNDVDWCGEHRRGKQRV